MIPIAFRRMVSKVVATLGVVGREQGLADRGWQDKSRKVRPVGRVRIESDFSDAANIAKIRHNLLFLLRGYRRSAFGTLRRT